MRQDRRSVINGIGKKRKILSKEYCTQEYLNGTGSGNDADESGAAIYRQSETPNIYKEEAESVMIVMSTASKGLKASVIFSDRHTDRTWEEEKNALCRISHQIFNRLRMLKNAEKDQRELNRKLNYDALTGLPVYNKFVDKLEAYMAANGKVGLYFVSSDFSNFQYVNEMYGYEVGPYPA